MAFSLHRAVVLRAFVSGVPRLRFLVRKTRPAVGLSEALDDLELMGVFAVALSGVKVGLLRGAFDDSELSGLSRASPGLSWASPGLSRALLGPPAAILGPFWAILGPSWGHPGAILGPSWGHSGLLGQLWAPGAILGSWSHSGLLVGRPVWGSTWSFPWG